MLLLATLLWVIWATNVYEDVGGPPGTPEPPPDKTFPTYAQCMKELDEELAFMERAGVLKRVGKYETESLIPFPYGLKFTQRWECKELTI